jgi:formylglycine-generating enzyme required for sulfatase activity
MTSTESEVSPKLPKGLRRAHRDVPTADGTYVPLCLFELPDGSDMEMVAVPAGDFIMGTDDADAPDWEKPRHVHPITGDYWIGRYDVTRAQYKVFCDATGHTVPGVAHFEDQLNGNTDTHPVVMVSWDDVKSYCAWAGLSMPTDAEWEKAARGTDGRKYPWGDRWDRTRANYLDASVPGDKIMMGNGSTMDEHMAQFGGRDLEYDDGFPYTSPVGSFPTGVSPNGALDMAGNVFNWVEDWWDEAGFPRAKNGDFSAPQDGTWRVDRGSSWGNPGVLACRTTMRYGYPPSERNEHLGFRVVLRSAA